MTVDVTSYQDAFANFDKGITILNLMMKPLKMSTKPRDIFQYSENQISTLLESSFSMLY